MRDGRLSNVLVMAPKNYGYVFSILYERDLVTLKWPA